jgi:hypothetical protein
VSRALRRVLDAIRERRETPETPDAYQLRLAEEAGAEAASEVYEPALRRLAEALDARVLARPDHPWVPGSEFADGELLAALAEAAELLAEAEA